jgi:hypothetical protein
VHNAQYFAAKKWADSEREMRRAAFFHWKRACTQIHVFIAACRQK